MLATILGSAAAFWGSVVGVAPLLQIRRILRRRSAKDLSLGYLGVLEAGFVLWTAYGLAASNPVVVVPNTIALLVGTLAFAVAIRYR